MNYSKTPDGQITASQPTDPANAAGGWTKSCPLCCTLNYALSLECFNCGWRGVFCGTAAAAGRDLLFGQTTLSVKAPSLGARWRTLKNWLFFIGSHRYGDTLK